MPHSVRIFHHGLDAVALEDDDSEDVADGVTDGVQNILRERTIKSASLHTWKLSGTSRHRRPGLGHVVQFCWTYSGDGVQRVLDGQQQNLVSARGVIGVGGSGDPLAGGEVEVGLLLCNKNSLAGATGHTALGARHAVELHQSLMLERHHHHVAACRAEGASEGAGLQYCPTHITGFQNQK